MDSIQFPVETNLEDASVKKVVTDLMTKLKTELAAQSAAMLTDPAFTNVKPTVKGKAQFTQAGKAYEISATASVVKEGESEFNKFAATIKEIRDQTFEQFELDRKRLEDFKKSIKHSSLGKKKDELSGYLNASKDLEKSLQGLVPEEQLSKIQEFVKSSKFFSKGTRGQYLKELDNISAEFSEFDPSDKINTIKLFIQRFGDINEELTDRLTKVTKAYDRSKFSELKTSLIGAEPGEKISAYNEFLKNETTMVNEIQAQIRLETKKMQELTHSTDLKKLEKLRTETAMMKPEGKIRAVDEFIKNTNASNDIIMKARNIKFRAQDALDNDRYRKLIENLKGRDPDEQLKFLSDYMTEGGPGVSKVENLIRQVKDKKKGFDWKKLVERAQQEKPDIALKMFDDYLRNGGEEVQKAKNMMKIFSDRKENLDWSTLAENLKISNPTEAIKQINEYLAKGGAFKKRAQARLNSEVDKLNNQSWQELKLQTAEMEPKDAIKKFEKYIRDKGAFRKKAENEISKLVDRQSGLDWKALTESIAGLDPKSAMTKVNDYLLSGGAFKSRAQALYRKLGDTSAGLDWRRLKESLKHMSPDEAMNEVQKYLDNKGAFTKRAENEMKHLQDKKKNLDWRNLRTRLAHEDPSIAIAELNNYITSSGKFTQQAKNMRAKFKDKKANLDWKDLSEAIQIETPQRAMDMIQDYLNAGGKFVNRAKAAWNKQADKLDNSKWKETLLDIEGMDPSSAIARVQQYISSGGKLVKTANNRIKKLGDKQANLDWKEVEKTISTGTPQEGLDKINEYLRNSGKFIEKAEKARRKINDRIENKEWFDLKRSMRGKDPDEQAQILDAASRTGTFTTEGWERLAAEQRVIQKRQEAFRNRNAKKNIDNWKEWIQGLDISQQLPELERVINDPASSAELVRSAKKIRQRTKHNAKMNAEAAERKSQRDFANMTLVASGAGLGLLGAAGFPLLNVGFAAMSGGVPGAAITAFTTALGESIRALNSFNQENVNAARSIGFMSKNFKTFEATRTAVRAFEGIGPMTAEMLGYRERQRIYDETGFMQGVGGFGSGMSAFWEGIKTKFIQNAAGSERTPFNERVDFGSKLSSYILKGVNSIKDLESKLPEERKAAYDALQREFNRPMVGVETDPYQTWMRMQNEAFDPNKAEERRIQEEILAALKKQIEIAKEAKEASEKPKSIWENFILSPF